MLCGADPSFGKTCSPSPSQGNSSNNSNILEHHAKKFPKPYFLQPKPLSPKTHGVFEDLDLYKA